MYLDCREGYVITRNVRLLGELGGLHGLFLDFASLEGFIEVAVICRLV